MTLNCYKFKFSRNFALLRIFGRPTYQGCRALTFALARLSCYNSEWRHRVCATAQRILYYL